MSFIFWVKSRDDANVEDLVPSFKTLNVIDPKFERAVMVIDFTKLVGPLNNPSSPEGEFIKGQRLIWKDLVDGWGYANVPGWDDNSFDINLNDAKSKAPDYLVGGKFPDLPVVELLKHKIVVMYNDDVYVPNLTSYKGVYAAIDAGVNVWLTMRAPVFGALGPVDICESSLPPAVGNYGFYFAASSYSYSGWFRHYFTLDEQKDWYSLPMRVEHFIGANSLESTKWPNLPIDTALLHERYNWNRPGLGLLWIPEVAALPEVNWMAFRARFFQSGFVVSAEPMYLFNSSYGVDHPGDVGDACLSGYDGSPVAHRVQGSYFRTVHFSFTPLAIQPDSMQIITDTVFNYLYEPDQNAPLTKKNIYRYENLSIGQR